METPRPPEVPGVRWELRSLEGRDRELAAYSSAAGAVARATVTFRERAPAEWRVTLGFEAAAPEPVVRAAAGWAEGHARAQLASNLAAGDSVLFCIDNAAGDGAARETLASFGLHLSVAEDELRRQTNEAPIRQFPPGLQLQTWNEHSAPLFFHAYSDAFSERPGFPNWEEARWRGAFASGDEFRPDLSVVVLDGAEPAAFAVLWVEDEVGWVTQMGVRRAWRGSGLGEALLSHALQAFAAETIETAALEVATNNPTARALYERMGFTLASSYESWRKTLS